MTTQPETPRFLTEQDRRDAFTKATSGFSNARHRWQERFETGLTDQELAEALRLGAGHHGRQRRPRLPSASPIRARASKSGPHGKASTSSRTSRFSRAARPLPWPATSTAFGTLMTGSYPSCSPASKTAAFTLHTRL